MAVNFRLNPRYDARADDPLKRSWLGWDKSATDDQIWAANRGLWSLADGAPAERFATLSYRGVVQVVAEITDRVRYAVDGGSKWALVGEVLHPGDPVRDDLVGWVLPATGNPVTYLDTSELDALSSAERAAVAGRDQATVLVTWNPAKWPWDEHERAEEVAATEAGKIVSGQWSTGQRQGGVEPGDRAFLLMQGDGPRGIIGSGTCTSRIFQDTHWDLERRGEQANYVLIEWDALVANDDALPRADLIAQIPAGGEWKPQSSGTLLAPDVARALERLWAQHLGLPAPVPPRTSPRQGWQLDAVRRRKVENAAQDRLTKYFEARGWTVKDVRYGNPYDALATKPGQTRYLEAKGTETDGSSVIVSRGEVDWARNHAGQCVLGVLSEIRFLPDGEVDPDSGTFRVFTWNPDAGTLAPRQFDWTPSKEDEIKP